MACGGGGGSRSGGGSGATTGQFNRSDLGGLWRGSLAEDGSAELVFGMRFGSDGSFQRAGETYREYAAIVQSTFADDGQLVLTVTGSNGSLRLELIGAMNEDKDLISGTWRRLEGGALVGFGTFAASPDSPTPSPLDFTGLWAGDFFSDGSTALSAASFKTDPVGTPEEVAIGAQLFQQPFDSFSVGVAGEMLEIDVESTSLQLRYELIGELNPQGTVLIGTWRSVDVFFGGGALDIGTFALRLDLPAEPRTESEIGGIWVGAAVHPVFGETSLDLELDATGAVVTGSFGEFGGSPVDLVAGDADMTTVYSSFAASLDDTFSQFGSDTIEVEGVFSPISGVWSGSLLHYFWGPCTYSLVKQ